MKHKTRWKLLTALGAVLLLAVGATVALRFVVDPESYRGLLRSNLEQQLGRPVEFGEMDLSFWPVLGLRLDDLVIGRTPSEQFDNPVQADSVRVGARLFPLLRGTLDVTSLTVEGPVVKLYRRDDGTWEPSLPQADDSNDETGAEPATLLIERLRITRGRVVLRRGDAGAVHETTLGDLTLQLDGLGTSGPIAFELSAGAGGSSTLSVKGRLHPADEASGEPLRLESRLELERLQPAAALEWFELVAPSARLPENLFVDRPFSLSANLAYSATQPSRLSISDATLRGPGVRLVRSAAGDWNFQSIFGESPDEVAAAAPEATTIQLSDLTIDEASVSIETLSAGGPASFKLDVPRLSLDRLPTTRPATLELDARMGSGKLTLRGTLGPLEDDAAKTPLDLSLKLESFPLSEARILVPALENLDASKASAAADLQLVGTFAGRLKIGGSMSVSKATVVFTTPSGETRSLPLDLRLRGDVDVRDRAARIEFPKLELELPRNDSNRTLTFGGFVAAASDPPRFDLELQPTRVAADDLAALAALLAPDAPLAFASPEPVDLQLRAVGVLGGEDLPDLEGRATLSGFTFRYTGMTQPMEQVRARVAFSRDRVTLDDLAGVIGKSDVTDSRVVLTNFDAPRVEVDLKSRNADFWELFSFVGSNETTATTGGDAFSRITVNGKLRIEQGSIQTLSFKNLTSGMALTGGVLSLTPLEMDLYGGHYSGRLVHDLNNGTLTVGGDAGGVEADDFLRANLDLGGVIAGRASTELKVQVRALNPDNILAGVSGGGPLTVLDGKLAKLDVLRSLSKAAGIFGESSLKRLTRQLSTSGTQFSRAETRLGFNSGTLSFDDVRVETPEFSLAGSAALDSATGRIQGRFAVAFSPELSATMRAENSRAASVFWDSRSQRVNFGFGLQGPASAPEVKVDWEGALRGAAERNLGDRLRGLLGDKSPSAPPPPAPVQPQSPGDAGPTATVGTAPDASPPGMAEPAAPEPPAAASGLVAEITRTRWTGPVLLRDLALEGVVRGAAIDRASLTLIDARNAEIQKIERLRSVDDQLASVADPSAEASLSWQAEIDGKRLALARFPIRVTLTVYDRNGKSSSTTREVNR